MYGVRLALQNKSECYMVLCMVIWIFDF